MHMNETRLRELIAEAVASAAIQPELLKGRDAAKMLSISPPTLCRLRDEGKIPFVYMYGRKIYRRKDVLGAVVMAAIRDLATVSTTSTRRGRLGKIKSTAL